MISNTNTSFAILCCGVSVKPHWKKNVRTSVALMPVRAFEEMGGEVEEVEEVEEVGAMGSNVGELGPFDGLLLPNVLVCGELWMWSRAYSAEIHC